MGYKSSFTESGQSAAHDTDAICAVAARCLGIGREQLTAETLLLEDLGVDSIDMLALAVELEEEFDVVITDDVLCRIRTIGDAIPCIVGALKMRRMGRGTSSVSRTTPIPRRPA